VETTDSEGTVKNKFLQDNVYIKGSGYDPSWTYALHVVEDTDWSDGTTIPNRVDRTETEVTTDGYGNIPIGTVAWTPPLILGKYDIIIDVNNNGNYDEGIDALDDRGINVTAGFLVIPEYLIGTILGLAGCFAAFGVFRVSKHKRRHQ